jgi:hypothetical protein
MTRSVNRRALGVVAAVLLAQAVLVLAFVVPGHDPTPHDVPVGAVGPPGVAQGLEGRAPEALDVTRYPAEAAARDAILARDVYGAVVVDGGDQRLLVASAASPAVAQLLQATVDSAAEQAVPVQDVAPLDPDDPRGATINLMFLPLIVVCLPVVLVLGHLGLRRRDELAVLAVFAALGGLLVIGLVSGWLGALPGSYLALSGIAALIILAIALPAAGLGRAMGPAGVGVAALLFFVIGNPGSGNASAPELLPAFWRAVGPLLPPGAGGEALRATAYFDAAAIGWPLVVLAAWAALGALLVAVAGRRGRPEPPRKAANADALRERVAA